LHQKEGTKKEESKDEELPNGESKKEEHTNGESKDEDSKEEENKKEEDTESTKNDASKKEKPKEKEDKKEDTDSSKKEAPKKGGAHPKKKTEVDVINFPKEAVVLARIRHLVSFIMKPPKATLEIVDAPKASLQTTLNFTSNENSAIEEKDGEFVPNANKKRKRDDEPSAAKKPKAEKKPKEKKEPKEKKKREPKVEKTIVYAPCSKDENGNPIFPIPLGIISILDLGKISNHPNFHTERYIYPIGFKSSRKYVSMKDGSSPILYVNEILDQGKNKPMYKVTPEDDPENPIVVDSSSAAWKQILEKVNQQRHPDEKKK